MQLTGRTNYQAMTDHAHTTGFSYTHNGVEWGSATNPIDWVANPDHLADVPAVASFVLVEGSKLGIFTTHQLDDHVNEDSVDFEEARRVINGTDKAAAIAAIAEGFAAVLSSAGSP